MLILGPYLTEHPIIKLSQHLPIYVGYPESNLRFGIKKPQVKRNIFYYLNLKATILNYFST